MPSSAPDDRAPQDAAPSASNAEVPSPSSLVPSPAPRPGARDPGPSFATAPAASEGKPRSRTTSEKDEESSVARRQASEGGPGIAPEPDARLFDALRDHEKERAALEGSISRYERGEELGRGGIAVVYRAWDRKLRRDVALKVLHAHLESSPEARTRFQREWQAAARLSHPNIVTVYDAGEEKGQLFLVMELVPGTPLNRVLLAHRYEMKSMLELLEKVAGAVHHAHESGVVHRDLKPANILVSEGGEPKVADFGLAHLSVHESMFSTAGAAVGTPVYMAPEQVLGNEIDRRTDVYALGAILYEIATGRPPHTGAAVSEIFAKVIGDDPVLPRKINPRAPAEVEIIAMKALDKAPRRRYESALAFADDLRRHLEHRPILAHPPSLISKVLKRIRRRPALSGLLTVLLFGALTVLGVVVGGRVRHAQAVDRLREEARKADAEGRTSEAADAFSRLRQLEPGDAEAAGKSVDLRNRALEEDRKRRARGLVDASRRLKSGEIPQVETERAKVAAEAEALGKEVLGWEGPERKRAIWERERRTESLNQRVHALRARVLDDLTTAYFLDPGNDFVRHAYLEECWDRMREAEEGDDAASVAAWSERIRSVRDEPWISKLDAGGTLTVESDPAGAEISLFRYEEGEDRRSIPRPHRAGPALPRGSYLVVLKKPGFVDVRYPVWIERGTRHVAKIRLYAESQIGADFVYVPAGPFLMGGDPHAYLSGPRHVEVVKEDFFIGRYEVTAGEYLAFLNDLIAEQGGGEAQKRVPRSAPTAGYCWEIPPDARATELPAGWSARWPVSGISWYDADAYCRWRTKKSGATHRLPTNQEWEKAARGADGRLFPWGNHFDWGFTKGGDSRPGKPELEEVGTFGKDESPYGVRDMSGSLREWCEPKDGERRTAVHIRGGVYSFGGISSFRVSARLWLDPENATPYNGIRIVRVPKR